jgi:hypothetical protein
MPILDSQVHAYERNHSRRPWIGTLYGPPEVTGDPPSDAVPGRLRPLYELSLTPRGPS